MAQRSAARVVSRRRVAEYKHGQEHFFVGGLDNGASMVYKSNSSLTEVTARALDNQSVSDRLRTASSIFVRTMTAVMDGLEAKGCVRRARDQQDKRNVSVELDKKGKKIYQRLLAEEMDMTIRMIDSLKPVEQQGPVRALGKAVGSPED